MKPYEGCYATIEVPHSFEVDEDKRLRKYFDHHLPGMAVKLEYREHAVRVRVRKLMIDPHAYVSTAKAAKEWKNPSEASQLEKDPFSVVAQGAVQTLERFKRKAPLEG